MIQRLACLLVLSTLVWSCTSDFEHPDQIPTRGDWYVEPGIQERIDDAQHRLASEWAEWVFHFQRDECVAPPAQLEDEGLEEEDPFDDILDEEDDGQDETPREVDEEFEEEAHQAGLRVAGGFAATMSTVAAARAQERQSWLCEPGILTWECVDRATEVVVYESMRRRFQELPPTLQPAMLEAYVDDFLWALDIIAESNELDAGVAQAREVCKEQGSPLSVAVEEYLLPELSRRWGWERGERFPDDLPGYVLNDLIVSPCELAATYHRRYLNEYREIVSRWRSGEPTCFSYRSSPSK